MELIVKARAMIRVIRLLILFIIITVSSCRSQSTEDNIVLINVGPYDKARIANLITKINVLEPKVISLDIAFSEYTGDTTDKNLYRALRDVKKLVLPSEISSEGQDYHGQEIISVYLTCAGEFFVPYAETGFVTAKVEKDQVQIPRQFIVWQKGSYSEDVYYHFSVVTAMAFDSLKTSNFIRRHDRLVDVDYKSGDRKFKTYSASDVLSGKLSGKDIEEKIVMLGFLGPGLEDKFFSPVNSNPNEPDMYGLVYLANIVAQVLEGE